MRETTNYSLNKPDGTDAVNISDLNENMDIIDGVLKEHAADIAQNTQDIADMFESGDGYCKMSDGTLIQYGSATISQSGHQATVNLTKSFVDTSYKVIVSGGWVQGTWAADTPISSIVNAVNSFSIGIKNALSTSLTVNWIAIGRWKA